MGTNRADAQLFTGGMFGLVKEITAAYTVTIKDCLVLADTTAGAMTVTLPPFSKAYDPVTKTGQRVKIMLETDGGDLTIDGDGSETIDGSATLTLDDAGDIAYLEASSDDWKLVLSGPLTTTIADGSVTVAKIGADAVTSAKIGDDQIDSEHYVDASIDLAHMSANSVDSDQYVDGSIDAVHMSANSIDSDSYVDGSIDKAHHAAQQLDGVEITDVADDNVIGGIPVLHRIDITAGALGDTDVTLTHKTRVIDAWLVLRGAGVATTVLTVKSTGDAITDGMAASGSDKALVRAATIDDANHEIAASGVLRVTSSVGATQPEATVYVLGVRVA